MRAMYLTQELNRGCKSEIEFVTQYDRAAETSEPAGERATESQELDAICETFKERIGHGDSRDVTALVLEAMERFPESAAPHNLMGILLERQRKHTQAMRHFRAAYALDPSYEPARHNLEVYGGVSPLEREAYRPADCRKKGQELTGRFTARRFPGAPGGGP